jgi:lipopolysaccharide export system permease protein
MKKMHLMLLKTCGLVLIVSSFFFILLLELLDLFGNLWQYIDNHIALDNILMIMLLYAPKCFSYVLPVALLFSVSFTLGTLYANNELIAVLGSGMSFLSLILPLVLAGLLFSGFVFVFEEKVVIQATASKELLQREVLRKTTSGAENNEIGFIDRESNVLIKVDAFVPQDNSLAGVFLFNRTRSRVVYADRGTWDGKAWVLTNAWIYDNDPARAFRTGKRLAQYRAEEMRQAPDKFRMKTRKIEEMELAQASAWIDEMKVSGISTQALETGFFNKFSYALRVFMVTFLAASIGNAFRKNILLMCLLSSLVLSVVFFVFQLITDAMAKSGALPPFVGAFLPVLVFLVLGAGLIVRTRA